MAMGHRAAGTLREEGATEGGSQGSLSAEEHRERQYATAAQMANFVYVIVDTSSTPPVAATVDAAWDTAGIIRFAEEWLSATVTVALYTHRHEDHVGGRSPTSGNLRAGARDMAAAGATVYCMDADADSVERSTEIEVTRLADGGTVQLGAHHISAISTPGHTPGSCCYTVGTAGGAVESEVVFTGDTLFVGGFGRMSVEAGTGDVTAMFASLARLAQLPEGTAVLAGHNFGAQRISTIGDESRHNAAYRCGTVEQLAALAGMAPMEAGGPIKMNPVVGGPSPRSVLEGLDFSGCVLPEPIGAQCVCCQPLDAAVLRSGRFWCEAVGGAWPERGESELRLEALSCSSALRWSPLPRM